MKLNKFGHSDVLTMLLLSGIIGSIFIAGTYVWQEAKNTYNYNPPVVNTVNENLYELVSKYNNRLPHCYYGNCLFKNSQAEKDYAVFGLAELEGFFTIKTKMGMGDMEENCDSFVITDGTPELQQSYLDIINSGNTFNKLDEDNRIVININLSNVDEELKNKIINSNTDNRIRLTIFEYPPLGKGDYACLSAIKIIGETEKQIGNNSSVYCTEKPTSTAIGRDIYPTNINKYGNIGFLGELFTADDCGQERTSFIFGVSGNNYILQPDIGLYDIPSKEILPILQSIGFEPGSTCNDSQDISTCTHWSLKKTIPLNDILKLKPYAKEIKSSGCINCG